MFGGLPHYYNPVLNRLNHIEGLEIIVVSPKEKSATLGSGVHQKTDNIEFKLIQLEEYKTIYVKSFFKGFWKIIKEESPDVIVTIWPYILAFILKPSLYLIIKLHKVKLILKEIPFGIPKFKDTFHFYSNNNLRTENLEFTISKYRFINFIKFGTLTLIRLLYYNLCHAYVNYIEDAFEILGSYGVKKEKIFITYNSPDTDILLKAKEELEHTDLILPENKFRLIHVGRLVPWKRVDLLIQVTAKLKSKFPDIELIVVGDGPQKDELITLASSLEIFNKVNFVGSIYDPIILGKYFKSSSVYVLAGMGGLSINEAMCFDKPIICSVCDGTEKKLVREGYNGFFFREGDLDDLTEKIARLYSNPDLIKIMGINSGKIIRDEVNIHTVIDGYIRAFNYVSKNKYGLKYIRS
jgi:glycosyltransferase involved in cell wall biosynthesis